MNHIKDKFLILFFIIIIYGFSSWCSINSIKYKEIKKEHLSTVFLLNSSPTFQGYFYIGTDNLYHYFESRWDFQKDIYFKISIQNFHVLKPFDFGDNKMEVKIDILKDEGIVFGGNEHYKLYIQK